MRRYGRRRRVLTENTPPLKEETPLKEEEISVKEETLVNEEEISVKEEEIPLKEETSVKEETLVNEEEKSVKEEEIPLKEETSVKEETLTLYKSLEDRFSELENRFSELIFNNNKYLICIISCEKNREHKKWIKKSWLNSLKNYKNIDYLFIYGHPDMENEYEINDDELHLKCDDGYFKLNEKMTCLWRYLSQNHKEYTRYLKIDDDTFVNLPKLKDYLSEIIYREINYFGAYNTHVTNSTWKGNPTGLWYGPQYEGGFYGVSKEVIDYYVENISNESIENNRCEDKLFSDIVRNKYPIHNHELQNPICGFPNYKNYIEFKDKNKDYSNKIIVHNIKSPENFEIISKIYI